MVAGCAVPRLSDSVKTQACFSQVSRWLFVLLNLILLRLQLLSKWQPTQMFNWFLVIMQVVNTVKNFWNSILLVRIWVVVRMICWSLSGVQRTKDNSSWNIVWRSWVIIEIGLNCIGSDGVGKNARSVISYSCVATLFVTRLLGGLWEVILAFVWVQEGAAASGGAMVDGGIGHQST